MSSSPIGPRTCSREVELPMPFTFPAVLAVDDLRGEAAPAYDASLKLSAFTRELRFDGGDLTVTDTLRSSEPHRFTLLLHSDEKIRAAAPGEWSLVSYGQATPASTAAPSGSESRVEPNDVTAPGPPGSVDRGERQIRGERLLVTSPPSTRGTFATRIQLAAPLR